MVAVCFPADEKVGPGDRFLVDELAKVRRTTKIAVATKTDLASPERLGEHLLVDRAPSGRRPARTGSEIVPVSATSGHQVGLLADLLVAQLPEGPPLYPEGELTDSPEETIVAELIREAALEGVRDELPHSIAVVVEEMGLREGRPEDLPLLDVHANLFVERDSQKGIVIGHRGCAAQGRRQRGPQADRGDARHAGLPRPARQDRQGLAARPQAAATPRLLATSAPTWLVPLRARSLRRPAVAVVLAAEPLLAAGPLPAVLELQRVARPRAWPGPCTPRHRRCAPRLARVALAAAQPHGVERAPGVRACAQITRWNPGVPGAAVPHSP